MIRKVKVPISAQKQYRVSVLPIEINEKDWSLLLAELSQIIYSEICQPDLKPTRFPELSTELDKNIRITSPETIKEEMDHAS